MNRIKWVDIAKGIAIISVILGHGTSGLLRNFIFSFHIPLFFILSGYFFYEISHKEFLLKNTKRLIFPYLFTCACIIILKILGNLIYLNYPEAINQFKIWTIAALYGTGSVLRTPFGVKSIGAIWFLLALFVSEFWFNTALKLRNTFIWVALLAFISYQTSEVFWLPLSIQSGILATIFIYIGFIAKKYDFFNKHIPSILQVCMLAIWVYCIIFGGLSISRNYLLNGIIDIIGALFGSYFVIKASKFIEIHLSVISKGLIILGQNTLVILCFHLIELIFIPWKGIVNYYFGIDNSITFIYIIMPLKIVWAIIAVLFVNKVPILKKIFYPIFNSQNSGPVCAPKVVT